MSDQTTLDKYGYQKRKVDSPKKTKRKIKAIPPNKHTSSSFQPASPPDDNTDLLKAFDLDPTYGPAIGISRMERWQRAQKMGLNPDAAIEGLILQPENSNESIWSGTMVDCTS